MSTENLAHPWQGCSPKRTLKVRDAHLDEAPLALNTLSTGCNKKYPLRILGMRRMRRRHSPRCSPAL